MSQAERAQAGEGAQRDLFQGLVAAHALAVGAVLVTRDQAFAQVPDLQLEDWSQ